MSVFWSRADQHARNARALSTDHLMADLGKRTASGGIIAVGAQGVKMVLQLAQAAILARLLAPEDFGIMAMAMTVTGFVGIFTDLGLSAATVQRKDIDQNIVSALFFMNLAMGIAVMLACFAAAPIAGWFFGDPRVMWVVIGMAAAIPLGAASAQHNALLTRGMRWMTIQWTSIAIQFFGLLISAVLAWKLGLGYWAVVISNWVSTGLGVVLAWTVCPWKPSFVSTWGGARSSIQFGAYLTGFNFVNYFHRQLDNVLVGWRWGAVELGIYSRAYGLFLMPLNAIVWPMSGSVVSAMCRVQADPKRLREIYGGALAIAMWAACIVSSISFVLAQPLIDVIYGAAWVKVVPIFKILALSIMIQPLYSSIGWVAIAMGETKKKFYTGVFAALVYALAFRLGVEFGAVGVSYAYGCALAVIVPVWVITLTKATPVDLPMIFQICGSPIVTGMSLIAFAEWTGLKAVSAIDTAGTILLICSAFALAYRFTTYRTEWCFLRKILSVVWRS